MFLLLIISIEPKCHYLKDMILALRGMYSHLAIIWIGQGGGQAMAIERAALTTRRGTKGSETRKASHWKCTQASRWLTTSSSVAIAYRKMRRERWADAMVHTSLVGMRFPIIEAWLRDPLQCRTWPIPC
jgi:hypothetical protein